MGVGGALEAGRSRRRPGWIDAVARSARPAGRISSSSEPRSSHQCSRFRPITALFVVHQLERVEPRHRGDLPDAPSTMLRAIARDELRRAVHDQPAARPQQRVALAELAERVEHDVDTPAAGDAARPPPSRPGCGSRSRASTPCCAARRRAWRRTRCRSPRRRGRAAAAARDSDPAGGGVDQHRLARPHARPSASIAA